jgi:hypothetical protein
MLGDTTVFTRDPELEAVAPLLELSPSEDEGRPDEPSA